MDIVKLCLYTGACKAELINVSDLVLLPELREFCEQNACGAYGKNYTCPPHIGEINDLIEKLKTYNKAVIWQNIYPLEDSFDYEGMMDAKKDHDIQTREVADKIYTEPGMTRTLILGAGGCTLCESCAANDDTPCKNPSKALSSLEAYGINVSKIENITNMKYINGQDTVTYFSGVFFD